MATLSTNTGPVPQGTRITTPFGYVPGYPGNKDHIHYGLDLGVTTGTRATYPLNIGTGLVILSGPNGGYGTCIVIRWIDGWGTRWYLLYGHMQTLFYQVGYSVQPGAVIGTTDNTGFSFGSHLHFAVGRESFYGPGFVDPEQWLKDYTLEPPPPTESEQLEMTFTDTELTALHSLAKRVSPLMNFVDLEQPHISQLSTDEYVQWALSFKGFLSPMGYAARDASFDAAHDPGTPNNPVAIGIRRFRELLEALQLTQEQVNNLPEPKYTTLKKWLIDIQEKAQEA